jgi:hypothetical protein
MLITIFGVCIFVSSLSRSSRWVNTFRSVHFLAETGNSQCLRNENSQ